MKVTLTIDDKNVGIKGYVQQVMANVVVGVIDTLKGVPDDWDEAVVEIEK